MTAQSPRPSGLHLPRAARRGGRFAGVLAAKGVGRGDRVVIYMPMIPETVIGMLACARIGDPLGGLRRVRVGCCAASRLTDARPKAVLTASCGIEVNRVVPYKPMLDEAIELAVATPDCCIVLQRPEAKATLMPGRDHDWRELAAGAGPVDCVPVLATDPLYILYTSGTTGNPKGIIRDNGGHLVGLTWSMRNVYGVEPGEVYWAASDVGWVVGHSYIVYGPLFHGTPRCCTRASRSARPTRARSGGHRAARGARLHRADAFRAIKRDDPEASIRRPICRSSALPIPCRRALRSADPRVGRAPTWGPVIDHWWQTETGWPVGCNCPGLGLLPSQARVVRGASAGLGRARLLDEQGREAAPGEQGNVVIKLPLAPGATPTLWNNDPGFRKTYLDTYLATTSRPTPATRTRTATSGSWVAPTT